MKLTRENYYSPEADKEYMSCSQFEDFERCEAAAMARIEGKYSPSPNKAFLVGNYFHTFFEGADAHEDFVNEHAEEIFLKRGGKRAEYKQADDMIAAALADPFIRKLVEREGENEKIMTGELFGVPWRIRIDKYIEKDPRLIIDWKTVASIRTAARGTGETFVEAYNYPFRAAVYMEIEKQFRGLEEDPAFWLVCISKEDPPDKALIAMNDRERQEYELGRIEEKIEHIKDVKSGTVPARRCGRCAYCRKTNRITKPVSFWNIGAEEEE